MPNAVRIVPARTLHAPLASCALGLGAALYALGLTACARGDVHRERADESAQASPDERVAIPRAIGGGPRPTRDLVPVVEVPRAEAANYVGAHVELGGVVVQSLASDRAFWVGPSPDRQILVVLSPRLTPPTGKHEHEPNASAPTKPIEPGDSLDLEGTLRAPPTPDGLRRAFDLAPAQLARVAEQPLYVEATQITPRIEVAPPPKPR